jgi:hypothetical protein
MMKPIDLRSHLMKNSSKPRWRERPAREHKQKTESYTIRNSTSGTLALAIAKVKHLKLKIVDLKSEIAALPPLARASRS